MSVDWTNPNDMISKHFSVREALFLPTWGRMATEADGLDDTVKNNLIILCSKLDQVRDYFNLPIVVHCTFRPIAYNSVIGGAKNSSHTKGLAMDFNFEGMNCDDAKQKILVDKVLETLNMRMENNGKGANWLHLDLSWIPGHNRFFLP